MSAPLLHDRGHPCPTCRRSRDRRRQELVRRLAPWAGVAALVFGYALANLTVETLGRFL